MQFSASYIAAILAFTWSALAAPVETRDNTSQKWQLNSLVSWTPSGRPGSYPWSYIKASITDPNEINLGTSDADGKDVILAAGNQGLNCEAKWIRGESPLGRTWPCDAGSDGWWTMKVLAGSSPDGFTTTNFNLVFTRVSEVAYLGAKYSKEFEGEAHFELGTNGNLAGSCGGSGVCSWGVKSELLPFPIEQHEVTESS